MNRAREGGLSRWLGAVLCLIGLLLVAGGAGAVEQVVYYHTDALGSPVAGTDAEGRVLWRESYLPHGERRTYASRETECSAGVCRPVESQADEKVWYTGKFEEPGVGLVYLGARWYDPELGRFLSPDPAGYDPGVYESFNRYAYGNNNPYKYTDPDGRNAVLALGGIAYETGQWLQGNGFDGRSVLGALADGYNGEGGGFLRAAGEDVLTFGSGLVVGAAAKLYRVAKGADALVDVGRVTKGTGKEIGILRDAPKGKGNFGLGSGSRAEADKLGKAWVGDGYKVASDGKTLISKDGLKQYRPPSYKPKLDKTQANFEQTFPGQQSNRWQSNGHLDITD